eukprot:m.462220 g.462220  ORF g.462220 m.462220 type:complete len:132 (+) comp21602_c1_seq9:830-1225(+)
MKTQFIEMHTRWSRGEIETSCRLRLRVGDVHAKDAIQSTPLHYAAEPGQLTMVRLLLEHGADANAHNTLGNTPLHLCARHLLGDVVAILVDAGCNVGISNTSGNTAYDLAVKEAKRRDRDMPVLPPFLERL